MKVRVGFVSNSSTSSFVCQICGAEAHGYDMGIEDAEMFECENEHVMCCDHALDDFEGYYDVEEKFCPICNYQEISYQDAMLYLKKKYNIDPQIVFEEIKKINRRRKKLYPEEYVNHVFKEKGLTDDIFLEEIKNTFSSYRDYLHWEPEEK